MGLIKLSNNYLLRILIANQDIALDANSIQEFTIIQDMNKILPEFRLKLVDAAGYLTHLLPFDEDSNNVFIELKLESTNARLNSFNFKAYRKTPLSEANVSTVYDIRGLLDVENIFTSNTRVFTGNIRTSLESIASEIQVDNTEISPSLSYDKNLIQPDWNLIEFLNYLKMTLDGRSNEGAYKCFIKVKDGKTTLVFRTLNELISDSIAYKYFLGDNIPEEFELAFDYEIYDNFKILNIFGGKNQGYSYFDYFTNEYVSSMETLDNYYSLTEYFCVDNDEPDTQYCLCSNGRNNDYTLTYRGRVKSIYYDRLTNLSKLWLFCLGNPNIIPGSTIQLNFSGSLGTGNLISYQYAGFWLVERVIHNIDDILVTKLLLTRNGIDTNVTTTLYKADTKKVS